MGIGERRGGLGPPPVIRPAVAPRTAPWPAPPACAVERPRHPRMSAPKPHADVPLVGASAGHPQGAAGAHNWGRRHRFCLWFLCLVTLPSECGPLFYCPLGERLRECYHGPAFGRQKIVQIHHTPHTRRHRPMLKIPPLQRLAPLGAILQHDPSSTGNARRATHSTGEPGRPVWHAASSPCSLSSSSCVVRSSASKEVIESQLESSASSSCSSHSPPKP